MKRTDLAQIMFMAVAIVMSSVARVESNAAAPVRIGMIGLDTSHVPAFAKIFNDPGAEGDVAGFKIVAGYPGGSEIPASRDRIKKFTEDLRATGVEIVPTIPELISKVDVVLLMSVDGRTHLREAKPVFEARKPIFIDKPLAGSLADAVQIYDLGRKHNVPWFSSSSVRYYPGFQNTAKAEPIVGAQTWGPCTYLEGTPDMFNYGIHGIEALYTLMGAGCESVVRTQTPDTDVVSGVWNGGRVGTYRGIRNAKADFGGVAFTAKSISVVEKSDGYQHLCKEIGRFFKSGKSPVSPEETLEIMSFMEAADESKRQGGAPVKISEVISKARATARPL